jgi:hypothetical protein
VHGEAARCFISFPERIVIGVVVAAILSYFSVVSTVAIGALLPGEPLDWKDGLLFSVCGAAGVFVVLWLGHRLQRARGEHARDVYLRSAVLEYVQRHAEALQEIGKTLRAAAERANIFLRHAARQTFHRRLSRVELVMRSEFQPLANADSSRTDANESGAAASFSKLVEVEVDGPTIDSHHLSELPKQIAETVKGDFIEDWRRLLERDSKKVGFIPASAVLRLCTDHSDRLRENVIERLRDALVKNWQENASSHDINRAVEVAKQLAEVGNGAKLFSVDLMTKAEPMQHVWCVREFAYAFKNVQTGVTRVTETDGLGSGVIAIWHGEAKLDFSEDNQNGCIRFTVQGREQVAP